MNLIAKEYIATKKDGRGVLVLSEMAGAAKELGEALIVNPNNRDEVVEALEKALTMPEDDQIERNRAMQERLQRLLLLVIIFKSSYDKANRTSIDSFRGPGLNKGLEILEDVKTAIGLPILSDIHRVSEIEKAAEILDVIQIPAFLSRQTDLITEAARTDLPINIKKGQFLSPWDVEQVVLKALSMGNNAVLLTERGTSFGYNNLVVDMRSIVVMKNFGCPVVFDATHGIQSPGGRGTSSGGQREFVAPLARAAIAAGADGVFLEIHPDPDSALSDGPNSLPFEQVEPLVIMLKEIHRIAGKRGEEVPYL
jgi:2-dehydro-3-deoxyphosphooctonate aldolase (KDO 8-P synthase)